VPDVKAAQGCKRACTLSHWQKASPQALFIVVTGGYARIIKKESGVQMSTLTNKLLYLRGEL
jgi:hypothetical protein